MPGDIYFDLCVKARTNQYQTRRALILKRIFCVRVRCGSD